MSFIAVQCGCRSAVKYMLDGSTDRNAYNADGSIHRCQHAPAASGDEELRLLRELDDLTRLWEPPAKQRAGIDAIHRRLDAARRGNAK